MSDMGWSKFIAKLQEANYKACEMLRRKNGLIVNNDLEYCNCGNCELNSLC